MLITEAPSGNHWPASSYRMFKIPINQAPSGTPYGTNRCGRTAFFSFKALVCALLSCLRAVANRENIPKTLAASRTANGSWPFNKAQLSGGGGIRTHGRLAPTTVFKTVPIDHSGTPPVGSD